MTDHDVLSGHSDQGEGADALSRIAAFLDREFTRIDHKRLSGFCPCLFAADRPACLRDLRFGPILGYDADISWEDRPRHRAPRRQRGSYGASAGRRDDGDGGDGDGDGGPPGRAYDAAAVARLGQFATLNFPPPLCDQREGAR